jgi:chromosome segregation ATPase
MTDTGLLERARKLGIEISDTTSMLDSLEKSSDSLEAARHQISSICDELRMQSSLSRERLKWLTQELDKLQAQVLEFKRGAAP